MIYISCCLSLVVCAVSISTKSEDIHHVEVRSKADQKRHASIVRSAAHGGEIVDVERASTEPQMRRTKPQLKAKTEIYTDCDRQFMLMDEGTDNCTDHAKEVLTVADCDHAAKSLGIAKATKYVLDTHLVNPLPYPRGCFLNSSTNELHYNPSEIDAATITGAKVCMRELYINGTLGTNPTAGCQGNAVPILNYDQCRKAAFCMSGGGACNEQRFVENSTVVLPKDQNLPKGCYRDQLGCWGFNHVSSAPANPSNGTPVCLDVVEVADSSDDGGSQ